MYPFSPPPAVCKASRSKPNSLIYTKIDFIYLVWSLTCTQFLYCFVFMFYILCTVNN
ncbi:hypothetical protein M5D96_013558 [Drosophila gunungcola]|uniref:Uncharacterized protein n=1 Tax=Drosophila gunungcola TaxID=103775 RepID=A0A9Q0BJ92_9MUSC|nr:hypothetical protein M5D96_013558 [Drosophila gunungcola]